MIKRLLSLIVCSGILMVSSTVSAAGPSANNPFILTENLDVDPSTGSSALTIPIEVPQGRAGIKPNLTFLYNSSGANSILGMGWNLELGNIQRSTRKGVPLYTKADTFVLGMAGSQQELVDISGNGTEFRPEVEGAFMKIQFDGTSWIVTDKKGTKYYFGTNAATRVYDPADTSRIFRWSLERVEDLNGNFMTVTYLRDNNQLYPSLIDYTGNSKISLPAYAQVRFNYETRTTSGDVSTGYMSGFGISVTQRIKSIETYAGASFLRRYVMNYEQETEMGRSLLKGVTLIGSDGLSTLPSTVLTYSQGVTGFDAPVNVTNAPPYNVGASHLIRMMDMNGDGKADFVVSVNGTYSIYYNQTNGSTVNFSSPIIAKNSPNKTFDDGNIRVVDLNGDGFMDVVYGPGVPYTVWINNGVDGFNPPVIVANSPSKALGTNLVQFIDMNGDGKMDMLDTSFKSISPIRIFPLPTNTPWKTYFNTTGSDFASPVTLQNYPSYDGNTAGMEFVDINGDGYPDVVYGTTNAYTIWINNKANGFITQPPVSNFPHSQLAEPLVSFLDMNGDGLVDIVLFETSGRISIYFNNGKNNFNSPVVAGNYQGGTYHSTKFMDMNGDNLTDVMLDDPSNYRVLLNKGEAGFKPPLSMGYSPTVDLYNENSILVDLNGDGRMDLLSGPTNGYQAWLNKRDPRSARIATLVDVDNSSGGHLELQYQHLPIKAAPGNGYKIAVTPFVLNTVKTISNRASLTGDVYVSTYDYQGGLWNNISREFRGFKTVKMIDPDGNYSVTEYAQDDIFKGRPLKQSSYDSQNRLFSKSESTWANQVLYPGVNFSFLKQADNYVYDGDATGRRTQAQFFYDESPQYGNVTKTINLGEVDLVTGVDIGTDKSTSEVTYHNNTTNWLLGLPKITTVKDNTGAIFAKSTFYYDGNIDYTVLPSKGYLTKKVDWAGDAPGTVQPFTLYTYDTIGNLLTTTDSNNNTTSITYDPTYNFFPLTTTNALNHKVINEYYGVNGVALSAIDGSSGLWGQLKSTTDPNQKKGLRIYDTFGRTIKMVSPLDSIALPTTSYEYLYGVAQLKIITHQRIQSGVAATLDSVSFYDGLGRLVETKSNSETAGKYIVGGQTEYNLRGLPIKKYISYLTSTPLLDMDGIDNTQPYTLISYDAMGRVLRTTAPDGSYSNGIYDDWNSTSFDENGHMQKSYADAFGRLIKKEEYLGADGRNAVYPASDYRLYATTLYTYDPKGNLIQTQDAKGNITTITYDTLGRKIQMTDPDMGTWKYGYDVEGNLLWQQDAKGQKINFSYDEINRLKSKTDLSVLTVNYTYDDTNAQNTKGRLTNVTYGGGNTSFSYDDLGRELQSIKAMSSTNFSVNRTYDAVNRLVSLQYPENSKVSYTYNQAGLVNSVSELSTAPVPTVMPAPFAQIKFNDSLRSKVVTDSGTGANNGTATFNTSSLSVPGKINQTFNLNQTYNLYQYINMTPFAQATKNDTVGSFAFWIKRNTNGVGVVYSSGPTIVQGSAFLIYANSDGSLLVTLYGTDNTGNTSYMFRYSYAQASTPDVWQHFVVSQDGTGLKLYRNGVLLSNVPPDPYYLSRPNGWFKDVTTLGDDQLAAGYIGSNAQWITPYYNLFPGQIDDFRYYKKGLSPAEINALYNNGNGTEELTPTVSETPPPATMAAPFTQYKLNDNINTSTVVDSGTGAKDGTANFITANLSVPGKINKTLDLNPTYDLTQDINVSSFAQAVKNDSVGSFAFWIKHPANTAGMVYSAGFPTTAGSDFQIYVGYDGSLMVGLTALVNGRSLGMFRYSVDQAVAADVWQHFVIYQDGTGVKVYRNGTLLSGNTSPFYTNVPTAWFKDVTNYGPDQLSVGYIGANAKYLTPNEFFVGQIDDFRYYKKALTVDEIRTLYNNGNGTEELTPNLPATKASASSSASPKAALTATTSYIKNVNYNAVGQMTKVEFGNGVVTTYTYSPTMLRLTNMNTVNATGTILQNLTYIYDGVGNITAINDSVNTASQTFKYDALNRLSQATGVSYGTKSYTYDQIGNIMSKDGLIYTYSKVNAGPHAVTSVSDGTTITYDANGNMSTKSKPGEVMQYFYDPENRLIEVRKNTTLLANYFYDGDGGRVQKTSYVATINTIQGGASYGALVGTPVIVTTPIISKYIGELYEQTDNVGTRFIFLGSQRVAAVDTVTGSPMFYHGDHLGSTNVMTDSTGNQAELIEYDPYGKISRHDSITGNTRLAKQQFTGKKLDDETGLIFFGARYYDPSLGRFITPDTIVQAPGNPQTLNRYSYCGNNPINRVDPSGHSWKKFWKKWGDFISPLGRAIVTGDWAHFGQQVLNVLAIASGNPFIMASGIVGLFNTATSDFRGGSWGQIHEVLGYAQMALAVVGGIQEMSKAVSQLGSKGGSVSVGSSGSVDSASSSGSAGSTRNYYSDVTKISAPDLQDSLTKSFNDVKASVSDKVKITVRIVSTSNNAGKAITYYADGAIPNLSNSFGDQIYNSLGAVDWKQVQAYSSAALGGLTMGAGAGLPMSGALSMSSRAALISSGTLSLGGGIADLTTIYGKLGATFSDQLSAGIGTLHWGNLMEGTARASLTDSFSLWDNLTRFVGDTLNH